LAYCSFSKTKAMCSSDTSADFHRTCLPKGRDIAEVVSHRLHMAAARSCGICGWQSGTGAGFLRVLRFNLPILIPPNIPYSSIIRGWYSRPINGRSTKRTQSHPTPRN
jgi:hypothetical protein